MERLHINEGYLNNKSESLKKTRVGGREIKGNLETDETNTVRKKLIFDLADVEMIGSTWRETRRLKRIDKNNLDDQEGLVFISEYENTIWGRYGINIWLRSNSNTTTQKQNKGLACRISRNKHMIEISSEVFVVGPTRVRSYSTIMYKAVHMTYEASPSRHSQGLFKTQRDHCKTDREYADH